MPSSHKYSLELSQEAYSDLIDIQNYTYTEHGERQWEIYGRDLDDGMKHIMQYPFSGHKRDDISEEYFVWTVHHHVLIYRIESQVIYLVRVLHSRMDFRFQFLKE